MVIFRIAIHWQFSFDFLNFNFLQATHIMKLAVRLPRQNIITVDVHQLASVSDLKRKLAAETGEPSQHITLVCL